MVIELEFLDMSKVRIHEKEMVYENINQPIPNVGDRIYIEDQLYQVKQRDFIYLNGNCGINLKISFWCEELH